MATLLQTLLSEQGGAEEQAEMLEALGMTAWTGLGITSNLLGAEVIPTELQQLEVEKLAKRLKAGGGGWFSPGKSGGTPRGETPQAAGNSVDGSEEDDGDGDEESLDPSSFDLLSKSRVVIFEGKVQRRQTSSFKRKSKRHLILLNDLLLVTSAKKSLLGGPPKFAVHSIIPLDELAVRPYWTSEENATKLQAQPSTKGAHDPISCLLDDNSKFPQAFELLSGNKQFHFIAESDSDKRVWIETLTSAIFAYCLSAGKAGKHLPGWQHLRRRGTLASAAMRGEMQEVSYLLRKERALCTGLNREDTLNAADETGLSALHWAALSGNVKIVEELIESGASVDALNSALNSPLQLAAACGHTDIVLLLLEHGADATCKNLIDRDAAYTALVYAHKSPALTVIVDALASHGCFLDDLDCRGYGALHEAAKRGLLSSVVALHVNHCDMNLIVGATVLSGFNLRSSTLSFMPGVSMPTSAVAAVMTESDSASSKPTTVLLSPPSSPQRTLASSSSSASSPTSTMASPYPYAPLGPRLGLTALLLACSSPRPDAEVVRVLLEMGSHPNRKTSAPPSAQGGPSVLLNGIDLVLRSFADRYSVLRKTTLSTDGVWIMEPTASATASSTTTTTESSASDKPESANRSSGRDEVAEFVQDFLPSIMELAKKGCRPSDAALKGLRPSLSEAIMGARHQFLYHPIKEPDFLSLVAPELAPMQKHHEGWSHDKSSSSCLCCGDAFSVLSTRRHHCRLCGVLCCAACSSKSIPVPSGSGSGGAAGDKTAALRVCDSCYNEKVFLLECRLDDLAKAPPRASRDTEPTLLGRPPSAAAAAAATPVVTSRSDACEPTSRAVRPLSTETGDGDGALAPANSKPSSSSSLFSWGARTSDKHKLLYDSKPTTAAAPEATGGLKAATASSAASEALDALKERGQKLGELADKSAELSDESHQFNDAAAQLRKQMQKRATGWGL